MRDRLWRAFWIMWAALGILAELVALKRGTPLTQVARPLLLAKLAGSALVGGFIVWLGFHWLFDQAGLDWIDAAAITAGATIGAGGWAWRNRERSSHSPSPGQSDLGPGHSGA